MTVQDLITAAMRTLGVVSQEETPNSSELADGLIALNDITASWSPQILPVTPLTRESFPLTGAASYTIGSGGAFSTVRPVKIETVAVITAAGVRKPVRICSVEEWENIADTTATGLLADNCYYDGAFPTATLYLLPKPGSGSCEIQSYKPLIQFVAQTDTITLPPGYTRALRFALAVDLAPEYGRPVTQELASIANDAKVSITGLNQAVLGRPNTVEPTPQQAA